VVVLHGSGTAPPSGATAATPIIGVFHDCPTRFVLFGRAAAHHSPAGITPLKEVSGGVESFGLSDVKIGVFVVDQHLLAI
jgi:hypothetical protein